MLCEDNLENEEIFHSALFEVVDGTLEWTGFNMSNNNSTVDVCRKDDVEALRQLMDTDKDLLKRTDKSGSTLISISARSQSYKCFKEMVLTGADLNKKTNTGYTALHEVCETDESENSKKILKLILEQKGVDLNSVTNDGKTAAMIAYEAGNSEIFTMLLNVNSIDLSIKDPDGETLQSIAEKVLQNDNGLRKFRERQLRLIKEGVLQRQHYGYQSIYYKPGDYADLLQELKLGDLIEFNRGAYSHWAIWVGSAENIPSRIRRNMENISARNDFVCHRGVENTYNTSNLFARSHVCTKEEHGVGDIYFQPLEEVIKDSDIRINNIDDKEADKVFSGQDILDRLSDVYMGEYHLLNNNCEHFAKWARNDRKVSLQSLFAFYRLSFLMMVTFLIVMCIGAYVVWKDMSLEERNDTEFCCCRSLLDEDKYENVPYSYGEIFIAKRLDGENDEFLDRLVQLLESKDFSSVINSKQILIKSKEEKDTLDLCANIQFNSTISDLIRNSTSCSACPGSRDRLFNERESIFWIISIIPIVLIPWIHQRLTAKSKRKIKIFLYNMICTIIWLFFALVIQILLTNRCCKFQFLPWTQLQIIVAGYVSMTASFYEPPNIYNRGWKTLGMTVRTVSGYFAGCNIGLYVVNVLQLVPSR